MCKGAPLSTTHILFFDFMIGLGLEVFASSIGEHPSKNFVLCTSAEFFCLAQLCVEFPCLVPCQFFLVLGPICTQLIEVGRVRTSFVPYTLHRVTTGMRLLEVSDGLVVG